MPDHGDDLTQQLQSTIDRLSAEFEGVLPRETVAAETRRAFEELQQQAKVTGFLPVLAGRVAQRRLREQAEGAS